MKAISPYPVKTLYYKSESDEFSGVVRKAKCIDADYPYIRSSLLWRFLAVIVHRLFVTPAAYLYCKLKFAYKIKNKAALKPYIKSGPFLYGNHTQVPGDGFLQAMTAFPQKSYVVVNADNVSLKGTENLMQMIGCLPLPSTIKAYRPFLKTIHIRCEQGHPIVIYPEAHIWPYYTGVRTFPPTAFSYPVRENKPVFSFTTVYKTRKHIKVPRIEIYIDGPFFPDRELPAKAAAKKLHGQVCDAMRERAAQSDCEYFRYDKAVPDNLRFAP